MPWLPVGQPLVTKNACLDLVNILNVESSWSGVSWSAPGIHREGPNFSVTAMLPVSCVGTAAIMDCYRVAVVWNAQGYEAHCCSFLPFCHPQSAASGMLLRMKEEIGARSPWQVLVTFTYAQYVRKKFVARNAWGNKLLECGQLVATLKGVAGPF